MTKQRKIDTYYDPKQPQLFVQERRQAWMDAFAAKQRLREAAKAAKAAADAEAAAEKAASDAEAAAEKARKVDIAEAQMTDELLEHFDISGFHWPPRWEHLRGEDNLPFSCDVEERAWANYEKRFGCRPGFPKEGKSWWKRWRRFQAQKKGTKYETPDGVSFPAKLRGWSCYCCDRRPL